MFKVLLIRATLAGVNLLLVYSIVPHLPLSTFMILRNMKGIFVLLLSMAFGRDTITLLQAILVIVSFIGTILVIKPELFLGVFDSSAQKPTSNDYLFYSLLSFLPALLKASVNIILRNYCRDN
jgi:drug/metabolite transporter (DMT)-like permease